MRFSGAGGLPPSEWYDQPKDAHRIAQEVLALREPYGFDTETDGLGFKIPPVQDLSELLSLEPGTRNTPKKGAKKEDDLFSGDGLGATVQVICLAYQGRRLGVDVGGAHRANLDPLLDALVENQEWACGFNVVFDWNTVEYTCGFQKSFKTCLVDALVGWQGIDEDAEDTNGMRGLKPKAQTFLGLNMSDFGDLILAKGGIRACLDSADLDLVRRTRAYCTRDAWAHLGVGLLAIEFLSQIPWCAQCPGCGRPAFTQDKESLDLWHCISCGVKRPLRMLTQWDWHREIDIPLLALLKEMEQTGVALDEGYLGSFRLPMAQAQADLLRRFQTVTSEALVAAGGRPCQLNPSSPVQMSTFYFSTVNPSGERTGLGLPPVKRTASGGGSTSEESLGELHVRYQAPGTQELLALRGLQKMYANYLGGMLTRVWPKSGQIHQTLRPLTVTWRLRGRNPNLMNLPSSPLTFTTPPASIPPAESPEALVALWGCSLEEAQQALALPIYAPQEYVLEIRRAFIPPESHLFVGADYEQIEVRLTAAESGDANLLATINGGKDMHAHTASVVFSSQIPGLTYEAIFEAKTSKEAGGKLDSPAMALRWSTLLSWIIEPQLSRQLLPARLVTLSSGARDKAEAEFEQQLDTLRSVLGREACLEVMDLLGAKGDSPIQGMARLRSLLHSSAEQAALDAMLRTLGTSDKKFLQNRQSAKASFFGIVYGIGAVGLAVQISTATGAVCAPDEAQRIIDEIKHTAYPGVGEMVERFEQAIERYGYVRTMAGRFRRPAGATSGDFRRIARAKRQGTNAPIQGLAAYVISSAMLAVDADPAWHRLGAKLVLQIHDELVSTAPEATAHEALALMRHHMETAHRLILPLSLTTSGGIGHNLAQLK